MVVVAVDVVIDASCVDVVIVDGSCVDVVFVDGSCVDVVVDLVSSSRSRVVDALESRRLLLLLMLLS